MTSWGVLKESAASSGISIPNSSSTAMTTSTTSKESKPKSEVNEEAGLNEEEEGEVATLSKALRTLKTRSSTWALDKWSTVELKKRNFEMRELFFFPMRLKAGFVINREIEKTFEIVI